MSEYTPTTDDVRECYQCQLVKGDNDFYIFADKEKSNAEFDRWLAKVKAEAWDEGAVYAAIECSAIDDETQPWIADGENPYREADTS
jgi:hypothetical protein